MDNNKSNIALYALTILSIAYISLICWNIYGVDKNKTVEKEIIIETSVVTTTVTVIKENTEEESISPQ